MSLIIIDDLIQTRDGNSRADIIQFLDDMQQEDDKYTYLKYICSQEKINAQAPDFSKPIFFFNHQTLDCAQKKLQENKNKINKLLQENQQLRESQNNTNVNHIEQSLYKELYDEMQEKLSNKIVEYDQLQTQYSALENQQQEIIKKSQNSIQVLCQNCTNGNQILEKIKQDNMKLTQSLTKEQTSNNKLQQELREIQNQMQQLAIKHRNELDQVQNQKKMEYIDQLNKTQNMICRPCLNKQLQINDLENKIKNNEQFASNKVFEAERRIKQKDDEVIELRKKLSFNKIMNCQCLEKDSKIQQLQNKLEDLGYQLGNANKELEKLKKEYNDVKYDLENQNQRNVTLRKNVNDLAQDLKKQKELQSDQQQVINSANMEQQRFYDKLLEYEIKFQKIIQEKLEVSKQLNQQLEGLSQNDQKRVIDELKKYIQSQDKTLHQMVQEHKTFNEDFKKQMSQITKQAIKQSIIIQQQRYQE